MTKPKWRPNNLNGPKIWGALSPTVWLTKKEIEATTGIGESTVKHILRGLVRNGWVERKEETVTDYERFGEVGKNHVAFFRLREEQLLPVQVEDEKPNEDKKPDATADFIWMPPSMTEYLDKVSAELPRSVMFVLSTYGLIDTLSEQDRSRIFNDITTAARIQLGRIPPPEAGISFSFQSIDAYAERWFCRTPVKGSHWLEGARHVYEMIRQKVERRS